jgi:putative transposase
VCHASRRPQTWRTFLTNHVGTLASIDFFTVPTATFRVLYVFVVLAHDPDVSCTSTSRRPRPRPGPPSRSSRHCPKPARRSTLMRDRDRIYGATFRGRLASMGIEEVSSAPRSPWQNPFVERLIG